MIFPSLEGVTIKATDSQPNLSWSPMIHAYLVHSSAILPRLNMFKFSTGGDNYSVWAPYNGLTPESNTWIEV